VPVPESRPGAVADWRGLVAEAARRCLGEIADPAGPVHLNLPLREPLLPVDDGTGFADELGVDATPPDGDAEAREVIEAGRRVGQADGTLLGYLASVRNGVIVVGGGASSVGVNMMAGRLGWPVIAEPHSGARRGDNALRATDVLLRDEQFVAENRPDLVVVIGRVGLSRTLLGWLANVPHIVVSADGGNWDVTRTARSVLHLDGPSLAGTALELDPTDPGWLAGWLAAADRAGTQIDALLDASPTLNEPRVARDVAALVPDGATLVVASSMPIRDLDLVMRPRDHVRVIANRGVSGIDGFVSTAMGVALGRPEPGPTVALCGDLSLLHDVNGLMPGPDGRPDVSFVVINNDGGGIFSMLPQAAAVGPAAFERLFGTPHRMSIAKVAAAYDAGHVLVHTADELAESLASYGGVRIVEVRTDRAENAALHERLRAIRP
jgi:2-succinyl-5-enolpyruvyl-6-hydroxy-3-cyclohexene-1-carboxylate synthase